MLSRSRTEIRVRSESANRWICEVWSRSNLIDPETEVLLSPGDALLNEMKVWTIAQGGEQTMWNHFGFETEGDATMFVLRWSSA